MTVFELTQFARRLAGKMVRLVITHRPYPQEKPLVLLKDGASVIGISPTGSGKTLAYLLPLLTKVEKKQGQSVVDFDFFTRISDASHRSSKGMGPSHWFDRSALIGGASTKRQVEN